MTNKLRNLVAGGLALVGSVLPMKGLEAQAVPESTPVEVANQSGLTFNTDNNFWSKYMWLGIPFSEGAVYQPVTSASYNGLKANTFINFDLTEKRVKEFDLSTNYSLSKGPLHADAGFTYVTFENGGDSWDSFTKTAVDLSVDAPLNPSVSLQRFEGYDSGNVATVSLGGYLPGGKVSWSTTAAYNGGVFREVSGVGNLEAGLSTSFETLGAKFTPKIRFSKGLQKDIPDQLYGGLAISW